MISVQHHHSSWQGCVWNEDETGALKMGMVGGTAGLSCVHLPWASRCRLPQGLLHILTPALQPGRAAFWNVAAQGTPTAHAPPLHPCSIFLPAWTQCPLHRMPAQGCILPWAPGKILLLWHNALLPLLSCSRMAGGCRPRRERPSLHSSAEVVREGGKHVREGREDRLER